MLKAIQSGIFCLLVAGLIGGGLLPVAAVEPGPEPETVFLQDIEDMPLPPGLTEIDGERVVFDKPEGRIVRTAASGPVTAMAVAGFYRRTLPSLGWVALKDLPAAPGAPAAVYLREHERLEISFDLASGPAGSLVVRFALQPE